LLSRRNRLRLIGCFRQKGSDNGSPGFVFSCRRIQIAAHENRLSLIPLKTARRFVSRQWLRPQPPAGPAFRLQGAIYFCRLTAISRSGLNRLPDAPRSRAACFALVTRYIRLIKKVFCSSLFHSYSQSAL